MSETKFVTVENVLAGLRIIYVNVKNMKNGVTEAEYVTALEQVQNACDRIKEHCEKLKSQTAFSSFKKEVPK